MKNTDKLILKVVLHILAVLSLFWCFINGVTETETIMDQQVVALWQIKNILWAVIFELFALNIRGDNGKNKTN